MPFTFRSALRTFTVCSALLVAPSFAGAAFISPDHGPRFGPILFNPTSVVIAMKVGQSGMGSFKISQQGYNGAFHGRISCQLPIGHPRLEINGDTATVIVPKQLIALDVACGAAVRGGGLRVSSEPILISISL